MFQLEISDDNITNGTVAVSWCLDKALLDKLANKTVLDPQVIICVAPVNNYHPNREYRKIVPLKELMTYIEFRAAGRNKIWGFVSYRSAKDAKNFYLEKVDGSFKTNILSFDGDDYASWVNQQENIREDVSKALNVHVPQGVFAKEPPAWEKTWVNHLYRDKVIDQCEFRRRRLFAYTIQPFIVLFSLLVRLIITILAILVLAKDISFKYILHPLAYKIRDTGDIFERGSWAIRHLPEDDMKEPPGSGIMPPPGYFIRSFYLVPLMPLIWGPMLLPLIWGSFMGIWIGAVCLIPVIFVFLSISIIVNISSIKDSFTGFMNKISPRPFTLWYMNQKTINLITRSGERKARTYKNIPSSHKTIKLRFENIKSKVCKPFSV